MATKTEERDQVMLRGFAPRAVKPSPQPSALRLCRPGDPPQLDLATPILAGRAGVAVRNPFLFCIKNYKIFPLVGFTSLPTYPWLPFRAAT